MSKYSGLVGEWIYGRRSAFMVGAGALVVTMLCVGGAVALMTGERPRYESVAESETTLIPAIVTEDTVIGMENLTPAAVDRLLGQSRTRSAETIEAGEIVYAAAGRTAVASPATLQRLRGALDEASEVLAHEPPEGASQTRRERHVEELESRRASILDAAAVITQVRRVPAGQLPAGATTVTEPVREPAPEPSEPDGGASTRPTGDPSEQPSPDPSDVPSEEPTGDPSDEPSPDPSGDPSGGTPAGDPTPDDPSDGPTGSPTPEPTDDTATGGLPGLFDEETSPAG